MGAGGGYFYELFGVWVYVVGGFDGPGARPTTGAVVGVMSRVYLRGRRNRGVDGGFLGGKWLDRGGLAWRIFVVTG